MHKLHVDLKVRFGLSTVTALNVKLVQLALIPKLSILVIFSTFISTVESSDEADLDE